MKNNGQWEGKAGRKREKERVNKMSHHNGDQRGIEGKETPGKESLKQNGDSGRVGGCEIQLIWKGQREGNICVQWNRFQGTHLMGK